MCSFDVSAKSAIQQFHQRKNADFSPKKPASDRQSENAQAENPSKSDRLLEDQLFLSAYVLLAHAIQVIIVVVIILKKQFPFF